MVVLARPPFMNKIDLDWFSRFFGYGGTYFGLERRFDALFRALTAIAHRECGFFEYGGAYSGRECDFRNPDHASIAIWKSIRIR